MTVGAAPAHATGLSGCRICAQPVVPFLSFGAMPLADRFLDAARIQEEVFHDLEAGRCTGCGMVQLTTTADRELLFGAGYPYLSSGSAGMRKHFAQVARWLAHECRQRGDGLVVEIGCNDGAMCARLAATGIHHVGVEPASGVAALARRRGVRVLVEFFDEEAARRIRSREGPAAVVYAANVLSHLSDLGSALRGVELLLADDGVLVFEDPYLADILASNAFDQFYDEHVFYFAARPVREMLEAHGLELVDATPLRVHGGSLRYTAARPGRRTPSLRLRELLAREDEASLGAPAGLEAFRRRVDANCAALMDLLRGLAAEGRRVVGYGATAKSSTVINRCGITPRLVQCVCDSTPAKQGRLTPGAHLPVVPAESFARPYPDYALLFAWNHAEEIVRREHEFASAGGRWILYVPEVRTLPA